VRTLLNPPLFSSEMSPAKIRVPFSVVETSPSERPPMTPSFTLCQRKESSPSKVVRVRSPARAGEARRPVMAATARIRRLFMVKLGH
jgi:hypothetical protein